METIERNQEWIGAITHIGPTDMGGYWECAHCEDTHCGGGSVFVRDAVLFKR